MIPNIEPSEVGATGLVWLLLSYGYVLYYASNLIGEGSDLLMLVPAFEGLVGGVVLPLLGAVPDGAIVLFSGLGDIATAQDTLSVGVGALAGSTIMLLTIPFFLSVYGGRVDIVDGKTNYLKKPKLTRTGADVLAHTGVAITEPVRHGAIAMVVTTIPYFLIQVPAQFLSGDTSTQVAAAERWWALSGFVISLLGLLIYLMMQLRASQKGQDKGKRVAVMKKLLKNGRVSLAGALRDSVLIQEQNLQGIDEDVQHVGDSGAIVSGLLKERQETADGVRLKTPPPAIAKYLKEVLGELYLNYDKNRSGTLDRRESVTFFRDFNENIEETEMDKLFRVYDADNSGTIDYNEFIAMTYNLIMAHEAFVEKRDADDEQGDESTSERPLAPTQELAKSIWETDTEEEDMPEEFTDLTPEQQQVAIKRKAFVMLTVGTVLVVLFSDPMVGVFDEIAARLGLSAFYVSFVLAPIASNASEVIASLYYAAKKTRKTITVSLTALEGAAVMNNTFCLSIFMGLIFFRGLAWQYTSETIVIVLVQFLLAYFVQSELMTLGKASFVLAIYPLSLVVVAVLEAFGLT